jgi:hypothetical protein
MNQASQIATGTLNFAFAKTMQHHTTSDVFGYCRHWSIGRRYAEVEYINGNHAL